MIRKLLLCLVLAITGVAATPAPTPDPAVNGEELAPAPTPQAPAPKPKEPECEGPECEKYCASFKLVVYDRPDMIEGWKGKDKTRPNWRWGKGPKFQPQPAWSMKQTRGSMEGASCRSIANDPEAIVECCFELGSTVELWMRAGKYSSTGLLGPVEAGMSAELIAEKMPAPTWRRSMDPPISVFGRTIKKNWGHWKLNNGNYARWSDEHTYKINSWGPESETKDKELCYNLDGRLKGSGPKQYTNWKILRADDREVVCESDRIVHGKNYWRKSNKITECCYIKGREMILYLGPHSRTKAYLKFMGLEIKATKKVKEIKFVWGDEKTLQRRQRNA